MTACLREISASLQDKRIVSIEAEISLRQAVLLMARTGFSNLPVYRGKRLEGIINNRRVLRELGEVLARGESADAWLSQTPVSDILSETDTAVYYKFLAKSDTLQTVADAFEENRKLLAVCVTEHGRPFERIFNFITPADLPRINKILEDYV